MKTKEYKRVKAVIFDMDGTLLDTMPDIVRSFNAVFADYGYPQYTVENFSKFVGSGLRNAMIRSLPVGAGCNDDQLNEMLTQLLRVYAENPVGLTKPYEGIGNMLETLLESGIALSVLSNKDHALTVPIIHHFFPHIPFAGILGKSEHFPLKPAPGSALHLMGLMHSTAAETLFVGDSFVDYSTARNAGVHSATVTWGFSTPEDLIKKGCNPCYYSVEELQTRILN